MAAWVVWRSYGREDAPPTVRWVEGVQLTCADGRGFASPKGCVGGFTWTPFNVSVAWRPDDFFSTTSLAHEFKHAEQLRRGVVDTEHALPDWQPGGAVEQANGALRAQGL